eukprot:gene12374-26029_t
MSFNRFFSSRKRLLMTGAVGIGVIGTIDFNREVIVDNKNYPKKTSNHLGEVLKNYHDMATKNTLTFSNIIAYRDYGDECWYLYENAMKLRKELEEEYGMTTDEAENVVVSSYLGFVERMSRRALIRNGYCVKWIEAVVQDEFIR